MRNTSVALGFLTVLYSLYLGIIKSSNHFYEFMLLGLLLVLLPFAFRRLPYNLALKLYVTFVAIAIFADFFLVLNFTHLWYYSYSSAWEYAVLYLFIYPAGGFVMLASYWVAQEYFIPTKNSGPVLRISQPLLWGTTAAFAVLTITAFSSAQALGPSFGLLFLATLTLAITLCVTARSEHSYKKSYIRDLLSNPQGCSFATLVATYGNFFLHEYPNFYANQWVYTVEAHSILGATVLGIPFVVWIGWPTLMIVPVALYYLLGGKSQVDRE